MTQSKDEQAALALRTAYDEGPTEPIRERFVENTPEAGYRVQDINTDLWLAGGRRLVGRKIGLTSEAVQKQVGVDQPDFGMLFEDMQVPNGAAIEASRMMQPRAEGELLFALGADLTDENLTEADVADAISYASAAIEIVDSRVAGWDVRIVDTVADNASSGLFVVGSNRVALSDIDLTGCTMSLTEDGEPVSEGTGAACLGSPLNATVWLARKMVEVGRPLKAGDLVLSGALGPLVPVKHSCTYFVDISGVGGAMFSVT
jgi:2-keto-4-pentenoate hydratase